jgi:hypothetical protein
VVVSWSEEEDMANLIETVGKVVNVATKDGQYGSYLGITLRDENDAAYWFGDFDGLAKQLGVRKGDLLKVRSVSTGAGRNITFLNRVKSVEVADRPGSAGSPSPAPRSARPGSSGPNFGDGEDGDVEIPGDPGDPGGAARRTTEEPDATHTVTENSTPLGTLDDLAEGTDPSCYGGVIVFKKGTTKAEVEFLLRAMAGVLKASDIREYDGDAGGPVFYIP